MTAIALLAGVLLFAALAFTRSGSAEAQVRDPGPGPVQNLKVVPGETSTQLIVTWEPPADNRGSDIEAYVIALGTTEWNWELRNPDVNPYHMYPVPDVLRAVVTVSGPGETRYVAVIAINNNGFGEAAIASGTSRTPIATAKPGPVQNLSVWAVSYTQLIVTWSAPSDTGGHIEKYQIEASATENGTYSAAGVSPSEVAGSGFGDALTSTVTVDAHSTERYVRVRAVNGKGNGDWATANGTSYATVPGTVQNLAVMGSLKRIFISWDAPASDGGSAITGYTVEASATKNGTYSTTGVTHSPITTRRPR